VELVIKDVVVRDILPVPEETRSQVRMLAMVVLGRPEGLVDVREGTEVEVRVEVLHSWYEVKERMRTDVDVRKMWARNRTEGRRERRRDGGESEEAGEGKRGSI
jgi:hypothetical protein